MVKSRPPKGQPGVQEPGDDLYALALDAFVPARNAMAQALRREGKVEQADRVKSLPRPSVSAWVVNHLYWHERALFDALLAAGDAFRRVQQAQLGGNGGDILAALDAKRNAIAALTRVAARALRDHGSSPTGDMMRRVTSTLEALAAYGRGPDAPRHGRLMADVPPPGFEALAALVPRVGDATVAGHGTRRVLTFGAKDAETPRGRTAEAEALRTRDLDARRARARGALQDAQRSLRRAEGAATKARELMKAAAAKATLLERAARLAVARADKASAAAEKARLTARACAANAETAVQALQDAELALEQVRSRATEVE